MLSSDAFTVINTALIQTGNQPTVVAFDGTDEWLAGWNAYQLWLPYCLEAKDWSFQRQVGALSRAGLATWPGFTDAYAFPANCLHLITVWRPDLGPPNEVWGTQRTSQYPAEYKIIGQTIQSAAPNGLMAEWLAIPSGSDKYSATFNLALIAYVASSLYSSLNEDPQSAEATLKLAEELLGKAAERVAQQQNRRVAYLASGLAADPFTIISTALIQSGRQPPVTAWDGTDEWIDGWNAYQIWLPYCLEGRDWNFQTALAGLTRVGDATYPRFSDAYALPPDCIHLQTVWRTDLAAMQPAYLGWGMTRDGIVQPQVEYRIIGNVIETSAPEGLTAKYLTQPSGADQYSATFNLALAGFVTASLLGTDPKALAAAAAIKKEAEDLLQKAAARVDQQENRRPAFRSRMIERRRARWAPWGTTY